MLRVRVSSANADAHIINYLTLRIAVQPAKVAAVAESARD
jgi:hypothetical protein